MATTKDQWYTAKSFVLHKMLLYACARTQGGGECKYNSFRLNNELKKGYAKSSWLCNFYMHSVVREVYDKTQRRVLEIINRLRIKRFLSQLTINTA